MEEEMKNEENNVDNSLNEKGVTRNSSSSKSSLKDAASSVAGALLDNKYRSIKNSTKLNSNNKNGNNNLSLGNRALNGVKNAAFNKVANAHPALKAASIINNIRNKKTNHNVAGGDNNSKKQDSLISSDDDNSTSENTDDTSVLNNNNNEETQTSSSNPLSSFVSGTSGFLGKFSFIGRLSLPMKIIVIVAPAFLAYFFLILIVSLPVILFSGFLGMDEETVNNGSNSGNIDYGEYELTSDGDQILHESLASFLESKGSSLEAFNNLIASNVEESGYGTRAGVVAAAVTLIAELGNNYNVKTPYFWGGGHGQMISGADGSWGSNSCRASANGKIYNYCGLDCSGFVAWAIYNGGFNIAARSAGSFQNLPEAEHVSLTSRAVLQPGDLLESSSHVILVVGIDEEAGEYICAEAAGLESGVTFSRQSFNNQNYWGVNMEGFYNREGQARS